MCGLVMNEGRGGGVVGHLYIAYMAASGPMNYSQGRLSTRNLEQRYKHFYGKKKC